MEENKNKAHSLKVKKGTVKRLFNYVRMNNKLRLVIVAFCIIANTVATVAGSLYLQTLIDEYIAPLIGVSNPNYMTLITPVTVMIGIYAVRCYNNFLLYKINGKDITRNIKNNS